jgi:hypothetical protein
MPKKKRDERIVVVLYSRKKGWLFSGPHFQTRGDLDVITERPVWGIVQGERVGRFHHWTVYLGWRRWEINHPGKHITEEILDPLNERVTRHVEFMGQTYVYYSGIRWTYSEKHPEKKESTHVWIPDEKHKGDERALSMGVQSDIYETMKFMEEWRQEMREASRHG